MNLLSIYQTSHWNKTFFPAGTDYRLNIAPISDKKPS